MAYQIQYPPATPNVFESFMGGYNAIANARQQAAQREYMKLQQQALQQEIENNPQLFAAQLQSEQALAGQRLASENLSRQKFANEELAYNLENQFGGQKRQAEINAIQAQEAQRRAAAEASRAKASLSAEEEAFKYGPIGSGQASAPVDPAQIIERGMVLADPVLNNVLSHVPQSLAAQAYQALTPMTQEEASAYYRQQNQLQSQMGPADLKGLEKTKQLQATERNTILRDVRSSRKDTQAMDLNISRAQDAYNRIPFAERGWAAGDRRGLSTAAQELDQTVGGMLLESIKLLEGTGQVSEGDILMLKSTIPNRKMTPEAFASVLQTFQMVNDRKKQYDTVMSDLLSVNDPRMTPELAQSIWDEYAMANPLQIPQNLLQSASIPTQEQAQAEAQRRGL